MKRIILVMISLLTLNAFGKSSAVKCIAAIAFSKSNAQAEMKVTSPDPLLDVLEVKIQNVEFQVMVADDNTLYESKIVERSETGAPLASLNFSGFKINVSTGGSRLLLKLQSGGSAEMFCTLEK